MDVRDAEVKVTVHSKYVLNALRAVVHYYPGYSLGDRSLVDMDSNCWLLYHYREELIAYKNNHPEIHNKEYVEECNKHIDEVIDFLDKEHPNRRERLETQLKQPEPVITYSHLGMLFKPGTTIYGRPDFESNGEVLQPLMVAGFIEDYELDEDVRSLRFKAPETCFRVLAWHMNCDGLGVGRSQWTVDIKPFRDEKKTRFLQCFPTFIMNETKECKVFRQRLIKRGQKFFKYIEESNLSGIHRHNKRHAQEKG